MPLPSDPKVIFLGGLFLLALLAAAYVASDIVLPLNFAIILSLLLQPAGLFNSKVYSQCRRMTLQVMVSVVR